MNLIILVLLGIILVAVCIIDWRTQTIPDGLWLALALLGALRIALGNLGFLGQPVPVTITEALIGSLAASVPLIIIASATDGFGGGDIKLMFAAGIFLGWQSVLMAFFIGTMIGATVSATLLLTKRATRTTKIAFGPYLAMGIAIAALWGPAILSEYGFGF